MLIGTCVESGAKSDLKCGGLAQEVSEQSFCMFMLPRNHSYDILVKNMAAFYLCLKSLCEGKVKRFRLRKAQNHLT